MSKLVVILQGLPGSGKSHLAKSVKHGKIFSADHFRMKNGKYVFDQSETESCHNSCLRDFVSHISGDKPPSVLWLDNTNTTETEIAPYVALANAYGYKVLHVFVTCNYEAALQRQTHGVHPAAFDAMCNRLARLRFNQQEKRIPRWWGDYVELDSSEESRNILINYIGNLKPLISEA